MKKIYSILVLLLALSFKLVAQEKCPIIPMPLSAEKGIGEFSLNANTPLLVSTPELSQTAVYFQREMLRLKTMPLAVQQTTSLPAIRFELSKSLNGDEAYEVLIEPKGITIKGGTVAGVFNGAVSVLQLVSNDRKSTNGTINLAAWKIKDKPQFKWRGLMLDESRFFMGKEKVKSMIDWMAFYKLNRLHWHLTDEPGWRLEIKKYPKLALVGGIGDYNNPLKPAEYYTQQEIEEVVEYAARRNIQVIPEIDMPGHATAANRAYPQFSGGGNKQHPEFTFDPGNPETYTYLSNILRETNAIFPSGMLHLGGDEVSFGSDKWMQNAGIKQLMAEHQLKDLKAVEFYFMKRMADSLYKMNSKLLVWDELADADLPRDKTIIFWWRHDKLEQLQTALDKGYQTVLCPRIPYYFDFIQDGNHRVGRRSGKLYSDIRRVYSFSVDSLVKNKEQLKLIQGIQANLWTEAVTSLERVDYMIFPRLAAMAEAVWSSDENKNFENFEGRLKGHLALYRDQDIYFYNPFDPGEIPEPVFFKKTDKKYIDSLED